MIDKKLHVVNEPFYLFLYDAPSSKKELSSEQKAKVAETVILEALERYQKVRDTKVMKIYHNMEEDISIDLEGVEVIRTVEISFKHFAFSPIKMSNIQV